MLASLVATPTNDGLTDCRIQRAYRAKCSLALALVDYVHGASKKAIEYLGSSLRHLIFFGCKVVEKIAHRREVFLAFLNHRQCSKYQLLVF